MDEHHEQARKIAWSLRRGMRELDVMLSRYHTEQYSELDDERRQLFHDLLECEDPDIWNWVMGREQAPPQFKHLIASLRGD